MTIRIRYGGAVTSSAARQALTDKDFLVIHSRSRGNRKNIRVTRLQRWASKAGPIIRRRPQRRTCRWLLGSGRRRCIRFALPAPRTLGAMALFPVSIRLYSNLLDALSTRTNYPM